MLFNQFAAIDTLAEEIYQEFRHFLEQGQGFAPVLFLHSISEGGEPQLLELHALDKDDQSRWPLIIRQAVDRTDAVLWALATQVLIRRHSKARGTRQEELLFVFLVADASQPEAARIWSTPFHRDRREPEPFQERTDDPNLQMMVAHLTGRKFLH